MVDPCRFTETFATAKTNELCTAAAPAGSPSRAPPKQASQAATMRKLELWSPLKKRLFLSGLLAGDGVVAPHPLERLNMLAIEWSEVFASKPIDRATADAGNAQWTVPFSI